MQPISAAASAIGRMRAASAATRACWSASLVVGSPGKVVKSLSEEQIKGLTMSAAHYVDNAERFRTGLVAMDGDGESLR